MSAGRRSQPALTRLFAGELKREQARWRAAILSAIRPITAIIGLLGLLAATFMMREPLKLLPAAGSAILILASILPGLGLQLRAWLILLPLAAMCVLGMTFQGLAPNLFIGTLVALAFSLLLLDRRQAALLCGLVGLGVVGVGLLWISGKSRVSPAWLALMDETRATNALRIFLFFFLAATLLILAMHHVLRSLERLLREKFHALASLRAETAAKEELGRALAAREKAEARARELELLGRMASYFGHDTNNSLLIVWSSLDVLKDRMASPSQQSEALSALEDAASHIRDIASQLRAFGPGRKASPGSAELLSALQSATRMLRQILPTTIHITLRDVPSVRVAMEASELQRILTNLALNASDAMRHQGTLDISARAVAADELSDLGIPGRDGVALHVADTGTGISEAVREHMFEPFFTTKGSRGTGLGLASVKESVEACGGVVKVDSQLGRGTTFTLFLPTVAAGRSFAEKTGELVTSPGSIFVVEEKLVQAAIVRTLHSHCLAAVGSSSAMRAVELLRSLTDPISLLVVGGMTRPDLDELARTAREKSPNTRMIRCIDESVEDEGLGMPVTYLYKPFTLPELLNVVEQELAAAARAAATSAEQSHTG